MLPLLRLLANGQARDRREMVASLAAAFALSPDECQALLPSSQQRIFDNRVSWAATYLKKAGLLSTGRRGVFEITERGQAILREALDHIDYQFLTRFPEYIAFRSASRSRPDKDPPAREVPANEQTPEEALELAYQQLHARLVEELIARILRCSAAFFEQLVLDLLVKIGYGGSRREAAERVGQTGDGGIDGIIKEDRLGLDAIYLQAKRWQNRVGRPEIQRFVGALQGQRAKKGIFITSSSFTKGAIDYAANIETKVVLIEGEQLARLMIDCNVEVSTTVSYQLKRIDSDYFEDTDDPS